MTVFDLIRLAYDVRNVQILDVPKWGSTELFDLEGKSAAVARAPEKLVMLRSLLAERFHLSLRSESRRLRVYSLVVDKNGPKVKSVSRSGTEGEPYWVVNAFEIETRNISLPFWAHLLNGFYSDGVVQDATGLVGKFDIHLKWGPNDEGPELTTALREQLGLKLEPGMRPVEVLVVEHVERPDAN